MNLKAAFIRLNFGESKKDESAKLTFGRGREVIVVALVLAGGAQRLFGDGVVLQHLVCGVLQLGVGVSVACQHQGFG